MKTNNTVFIILVLIVFVFTYDADAAAFRVELAPKKIGPGDAFVIHVTGARTTRPPSATLRKKKFYFSNCGRGCFIAIGTVDVQTKPGKYTVKVKVGKTKRAVRFTVKRTAFPKLKLSLPEDKVSLTQDALDTVRDENERLKSIFQTISEKRWAGDFILPLENEVSTPFGTKRIMNGEWISLHRGLDIRGTEGEEVVASNGARVALVGELFFGGHTVILDHGQGIYTIYMHLSKFQVNPDDIVSKGDVIGFVGSSGRSTGPHLHFGVKVSGISVNPLSVIQLKL